MYHVYLLKSLKNPKKIYVGFSAREPEVRIKEHNSGQVDFTKWYKPWKLVYFEAYSSEKDARTRERMLKQYGSSLSKLKNRLKESLNDEKGWIHSA